MAPLCPLSVLSLLLLTTLLAAAEPPVPPFLLQLTHVLSRSPGNATAHPNHHLHLLKSASLSSAARLRHHRSHGRHRLQQQQRHHQQVSLPLSSGSDYTLTFSVGSRESTSHPVELYMDTGSDLVWFPCAPFECILCEGKPHYPPPRGSTLFPTAAPVPCHSPSCSAAHSISLPSSSDLCAMAGCPLETIETSTCSAFPCPPFYYAYGDGSLVARLRHDHLAIATALQLPNFTFGCAHTALAEPVGVAGFGRGLLSLPAQLARLSPHLGRQFSYCLVSHSFDARRLHLPSPLILGRRRSDDASAGAEEPPFVYTPMLHNPKHPYFYTVGLDAVSVGRRRIPAELELRRVDRQGNGGVVVDSGTTFTMLPAGLYAQISDEFHRVMVSGGRKRAKEAEAETGLAPCYYEHAAAGNSSSGGLLGLPSVALHFSGNASVALPRRNYFMGFSSGGKRVECLMLMGSGGGADEDDSGGPAGTLGNFQQQGFEVVYDLDGGRVGFARRRCAALWDSLSRG